MVAVLIGILGLQLPLFGRNLLCLLVIYQVEYGEW